MNILEKFGGKKKMLKILRDAGWMKSKQVLTMQTRRGSLSKEVSLILLEHALKNGIAVQPQDFYDFGKGER